MSTKVAAGTTVARGAKADPMSGTKTVITTFKNEAPYILEWVAHYRTLGFDNIVVYTNDCSDGTNRILRRLEELGEVTFRINNVGAGGIHRSALRQAGNLEVVQNSDWLFVCDIDEFLNIHVGNHRVDDLIAASRPEVDAIAIPWKIFSNNGRAILRNALVTEQFTDAELPPVEGGATRRFVKTLFRPSDKIGRIGLHGPVLKPEHAEAYLWATPGDTRLSRQSLGGHVPPPFGIGTAQLNHYAVRSVESYLLKKHRGRANHMSENLSTEYWDRWNRGGAEDRSIERYLPAIKEWMEVYLGDETLSRLHRRGFRWHKALLAKLLEEREYQELRTACEAKLTTRPQGRERPRPPLRAAAPLENQAPSGHAAPVGSLWIGSRLSFVEQMSLLSFVRQGHPVTLFTYGPVENVPIDVSVVDAREIHDPTEFLYSKFGTPVVQSDIFRLHMIRKTGMIWTDTDMVCLKPIQIEDGHVHGFFSGGSVCNALLRLPKDSPALAAFLDYVADPFPVPPWWAAEDRDRALALKAAGQWKHATAQKHDIYGPPALTHFLRESGELAHTQPAEIFYPVRFKDLDAVIEPEAAAAHLTENTRGVHLWARRLRWRLPQLGLKPGSFIHDQLRELEINPEIAPIPSHTDIWAPAHVLPRRSSSQEIAADADIALSPRQVRHLDRPDLDACVRLAEHVLSRAQAENLYGFHDPVPEGFRRGIDEHGTGPRGVFRLAVSMQRYANNHKALPDLLTPKGALEKLMVWKHFGHMPIPTPADKLTAHAFVPAALTEHLCVPERPWISAEPVMPDLSEIAEGTYFLKANHSHGALKVTVPLDADAQAELEKACATGLDKDRGYWAGEWWYMHVPRQLYLERHLLSAAEQDVPDWKFWTIGGRVALVQVDLAHSSDHVQLVHDRDLNFLPHELFHKTGEAGMPRPERYAEMVAIAEGIGRNLDFARIDLYPTDAGITVGKVALCPVDARSKIRAPELDERLSAAWDRTKLFAAAQSERAA